MKRTKMENKFKRFLSLVLAVVMVIGMMPVSALRAEAAEADGWYWDGDTLYIKDGEITNAQLYEAFTEKLGEPYSIPAHTYRKAFSTTTVTCSNTGVQDFQYGGYYTSYTSTVTGGTSVKSTDTSAATLDHNSTITVYRCKGYSCNYGAHTLTYDAGISITIKHYYEPTVTVSGKDGVTATLSADKVIKGETVTVTVSAAGEDGWTATVAGETKSLSATEATTFEVTVDSVAAAAITVSVAKASTYGITVNTVNGDWGTATIASSEGIAGAEIALTITPAVDTDSAKYTYEVTVNEHGSYDASTGKVTIAGTGDVIVTVTFTKTDIHFGENKNTNIEYNGWYQDATQLSTDQLNALKQEIFNKLDVASLPAGATWDNVTIQYFPLKVGTVSGGSEYDSTCYDLTYAKADEELFGIGYEYRNFGERAYNNGATLKTGIKEKVRITYNGLYIEAEITLVEARVASEIYYTDPGVTFDTQADIDAAVLGALRAQSTGTIAATIAAGQTLPTGGQTATLTYNVTVAEDADYLGNSTTVTITATAKSNPANITFETAGEGSGSVNFGGLTANGTLIADTYALTITPSDLDGSDGSAMYVDSVAVTNGTLANGKWENGVYTADITVANNTDVTVTITYGTASLTNQGGTLELNGYGSDLRWDNIDAKTITAVLGGGTTTDYTVYYWLDLVGYDAAYYTSDAWQIAISTTNKQRLNVPAYGETGTLKVKIVKAASSDGKIVELTLADTNVTTKESRKPAQISISSAVSGKYDTIELFTEAVTGTINVLDNNNTDCKADAGLTVTLNPVEGKVNTYTVSYSLANDGATWLTTSGTLPGEVVWNISVYKVTFVNEDGTVLSEVEYPYGTTADQITVPTATKADKVDENGNVMATYTFAGWNTSLDTVTEAVTYTATYTEVAKTYTITWVNGDETTTETYEYGATPTAPTASKTATAQYTYTFAGWDKEIVAVTGDATYTAQFDSTVNSYTITWVNGDETTEVTYNYGETPVAPAATKSDDKAENGNTTYYYTDGKWPTIATVTGDATYTATFTKNAKEYTVTWIVDGVETTNTHAYGTEITVPTNPSKEGHTFTGWTPAVEETMGAKNVTYTATWTVNEYTVTWVVDGEKTTNTHAYGTKVTVPADPAKTGYTFTGWTPAVVETMGADNVIYTATWQINQYTVTYKDTDGTVLHTATYDYNAAIEEYKPTKDNHAFGGWTEGAVPTNMPAENLTFTVKEWVANAYEITWVVDNVTVGNTTANYGETVTLFNTPTKEGYTFAGWEVNGTVYTKGWTMGGENVTATATWTINKHFAIWDVDGVETKVEYKYGETITALASPTKTGYTFTGWSDFTAGMTMGDADVTFTAQWKINQYTITFKDHDGSTYKTIKQDYNTAITAPADPTRTGYTFGGWDKEIPATMPAENITITATYTVNQYTITFVDYNDDVIATLTQDYGTAVTAPADPTRTGYTFAGWGTTVPATMPAEDMTIKATYEINKYTITWIVDGVETVETYEYNTVPAFTGSTDKAADAQYTYTFSGWDKEIVAAVADATYTAQYSKTVNKYTVTWIVDGKTTTEQVEYGTVPSFTGSTDKATANYVQYTFTGWDVTPVAVTGDVTYTAQYSMELLANNGTVAINGYYEYRQNSNVFDTLKADVLTAAGLTGVDASNYTVKVQIRSSYYDLDKMTGITNILNYEAFFLAVEVPESGRQFTITDNTTGVSKTVTMAIVDSRPSAGLNDTEITEVKVLNDQQGLTDYVNSLLTNSNLNPNGLTVSVSLTEGSWPPASAGVTTKLVYTVSYADDASYIGDSATLTVYVQSAYNNCTVVADSTLTAGGSLTVSPSDDNTTVAGNDTITITVTPSGDNVVETITVTKNGEAFATYTTDKISYSSKAATVTFTSDGSVKADVYTVAVVYSQNYLTLNEGATIVYCVDDKDHTYDLQKLVFNAIFGGSSAPMTKDNATLEYAYLSGETLGQEWHLWANVSKDPSISLDGVTHKFGEDGSETIRLTYSDDKYGSFTQTVVLNVFDSCYSSTVTVETVTNGADASIKTQYSEDTRAYMGVDYFKVGSALTVTLTPDGSILSSLGQIAVGTYSDTSVYIKSVTVYDKAGNVVSADMTRGTTALSLENILNGTNFNAYNAAVTFTLAADEAYRIVVEYGSLNLEKKNDDFRMEMYKGGNDYAAKVPSEQELIDAILGESEAAEFLAAYEGAYTVEYWSLTKYVAYDADALLAMNDGATVNFRVTWKPDEGNKTYYPVAVTANVTLVDLRTSTSVAGVVPENNVNFISEDKLIAELKEAMGLGILADGSSIDVDYTVTYTLTGDETNGYFATVTVTYDGSAEYKPTSKTFENVPVANRPDDATIKVTIQNASDVVTNNDGKIQSLDSATGIYTVIGNGTYNFKFTPVAGKAIESVTVNGDKVELTYSKQVATFSMMLNEKEHYEVVVETVDSVWVLNKTIDEEYTVDSRDDYRVYDFAYGITTPVNKDIVDAAVSAPTAESIDYSKVKVEYLARAEGTVAVALPDIDLGFTVIELGTFDIALGELWLDPNAEVTEYDLDKLVDELVTEVIDKVSHGQLAATEAVSYMTEKLKGLTIGAHEFGSAGDGSTETIRISYEDDKYLLAQVVTDVTIHDYRIATELVASDCEVTFGYSLEQLIAASGAYVAADDAAVSGLNIQTNDLYLHANTETQEVTLYFAGDEDYQPSQITINVTVNKAECSIDYDSQMITYGDTYDLALSVSPTVMPDGTKPQIDRIEFMIGLDMHTLLDVDIEDKTVGIDEAIAYIQLRLPQSIRELPLVGQYLQGEFTLGEFTDLINSLSDYIGIDESSMEILNQVIEAITGITDNLEIKVIIKDEDFHPTNVGVYIAGAVTVDSDFETAYTADYLIITPKTIEAELAWDYEDENGIMTLPAYQEIFADLMGAHVVENDVMTGDVLETANGHIKYLILGVNDETSEFLTTDVYGNIKANIWTSNDAITDNGAYVQIAYMLNWGNEIYYAMPIVRTFVIVPQTVEVELLGQTGEPNNELLKEFNNQPQGFSVRITDYEGEVIYSDHYQNVVNNLSEYDELTVTYIGLQTNTKTYNAAEKPVHAGAYAVVATLIQKDENGNILAVGMDTGILVIEPAASSIVVDNAVVEYADVNHVIADELNIQAASEADAKLTPDVTIITAAVAANGDFSENGWDAVEGVVNVDFPAWVDALLAEYAPSVVDGMTVAELKDKLLNNLPDITAELTELGATEEVINSFTNLVGSVTEVLGELPDDITLSFQDDATAKSVGAYVAIGVVTDSDHYPSVDAGILVIIPAITEVELKWNYEDENNIWTRDLLKYVDLYAKAYNAQTDAYDEAATAQITYQFIGVDLEGNLIVTNDADGLPNGAYIELAYIELEVGGEMTVSNLIARELVLVPSTAVVEFIDKNGDVNNDQIRTFNNQKQAMDVQVTVEGQVITPDEGEVTVTYIGVQTNTKSYNSTIAPTHAGVYMAVATYIDYDANGNLVHVGGAVGVLAIEPAESTISVTGDTVTYDGEGHTAAVVTTGGNVKPDYTLISGGATVSGDINEVGLDALHGNVNIDFPAWLDAYLAEYEFVTEGVDPAYVSDFITSYRDELIALIPVDELVAAGVSEDEINAVADKLNAYLDELLVILDKLPEDVSLTFADNVTYTEPGYYFYYGIVTDSDHYPSTDTGLLVIEKMDMKFGAWHEVVPYDGKEHTVYVPNDYISVEGAPTVDYVTMILDRENNHVNIVLDDDLMYVLDIVESVLGIDLPAEFDIAELREMLGDDNIESFTNVLINVLDAVLADMEVPTDPKEYSQSTYRDLVMIKEMLNQLPADGTISINGKLPVDVGTYEFYIFGYSEHYKTVDGSAVLFIEPINIVITPTENEKVYGENDPELTAEVTYYSYEGREDPYYYSGKYSDEYIRDGKYADDDTETDSTYSHIVYRKVVINELPEEIELTYDVTREAGEDVGTYAMAIDGAQVDSKNYVIEIAEVETTFEITKREVTVTVKSDATISVGEDIPEFTVDIKNNPENEMVNDVEIVPVTAVVNTSAVDNTKAGEYIITAVASYNENNYVVNIVDATLTVEGPTPTTNRHFITYQVGLIEPWFLRVNVRVTDSEKNTIDYSTLSDYGAYFIRRSDLEDPTVDKSALTYEDIMGNAMSTSYRMGEEAAVTEADNHAVFQDGEYLCVRFREGIYTYQMSDPILYVYWYVDADGLHYTKVQEINLSTHIDNCINGTNGTYGELEKIAYQKISDLEDDVLAYRAQYTGNKDVPQQTLYTVADSNLGDPATEKLFKFGFTTQITVIEPWGFRVNLKCTDLATNTICDYANAEDYGIIMFHSLEGTQLTTAEEMLAQSGAYVFSKSNGNAFIDGNYISARYNENIFTYQLKSNVSFMGYYVVDGQYYYTKVINRNIYDMVEACIADTSGRYGELEVAVYKAMIALCDAITNYREDYFANQG